MMNLHRLVLAIVGEAFFQAHWEQSYDANEYGGEPDELDRQVFASWLEAMRRLTLQSALASLAELKPAR